MWHTAHVGIIVLPSLSLLSTSSSLLLLFSNSPLAAQAAMCGIFFSLSSYHPVLPTDDACSVLRDRGPDDFQIHTVQYSTSSPVYLTFVSTALSLRGDYVQSQPLVDPESQSVLCWNGEAWKVAGERVNGNDAEHIFKLFVQAVKPLSARGDTTNSRNAVHRLTDVISNISGPFSFVFYDGFNSKLFFSRDCLGRRSLLQGFDETGSLKICSFCDGTPSSQFEEVDTNGVHAIDLSTGNGSSTAYNIDTLSWDDGSRASHLVCTLQVIASILLMKSREPQSLQ